MIPSYQLGLQSYGVIKRVVKLSLLSKVGNMTIAYNTMSREIEFHISF